MPIPKQIFQAWLQASAGIPAPMAAAINSWKDQNPEYRHFLLDENGIRSMFREHFEARYLEAYDLIVPPAFKVDFWRYCALYKFGGVYADSKMTLLRPLQEIIRPQDSMVVPVDGPDAVAIAFLAFEAGHPVLEAAINAVLRHVTDRDKTEHVLSFTGPFLFARALKQYLGISELATGRGTTFELLRFDRLENKENTYFYGADGQPIIRLHYDTYKREDCQEWKHYPLLWHLNVVFKDRLARPELADLPYMAAPPPWLLINK